MKATTTLVVLAGLLSFAACRDARTYDLKRGPFLTLVAAQSDSVTIDWGDAYADARRMKMERRRQGNDRFKEFDVPAGATQFVDDNSVKSTNVKEGARYFYRLRAFFPNGRTARSVVLRVDVPIAAGLRVAMPHTPALPAGARLSPDGGSALFAENGRVLVLDLTTGDAVPASRGDLGFESAAAWMPSGRSVVLAAGEDLVLLHLETKRSRTITREAAGAAEPDVSPEGDRAAFVRDGAVLVIDLEGGTETFVDPGPARAPRWIGERLSWRAAGSRP